MPFDGTETIRTSSLAGFAARSPDATAALTRNSRLVEDNKDLPLPMAPFSLISQPATLFQRTENGCNAVREVQLRVVQRFASSHQITRLPRKFDPRRGSSRHDHPLLHQSSVAGVEAIPLAFGHKIRDTLLRMP